MKIFGKDFLFNNKKVYHEGNKPVANDIMFNDGQNFQEKLDNGSLKGEQGDRGPAGKDGVQGPRGEKGEQGLQGPRGETGPKGDNGERGPQGLQGIPGPKGEQGDIGPMGPMGPMGPKGEPGIAGERGPAGIQGEPGPKGDKGETGERGQQGPAGRDGTNGRDGLTTSVTVNGEKYTHSSGNITLPNFLKESGGNVTGAINSSVNTGQYIDGNKGKAIINSTNASGNFTTLIKSNSSNGVFTLNTYSQNFLLSYTDKSTISSGSNKVTSSITLLNERGDSSFPGYITATGFKGKISGTSDSPTIIEINNQTVGYIENYGFILGTTNKSSSTISNGYKTYDIFRKCDSSVSNYDHTLVRFGLVNADSGVAAIETQIKDSSGNNLQTAYLRLDANSKRVYTDGYLQCEQKWIKMGGRWLTIDTKAPSGAKGDIWIQCL